MLNLHWFVTLVLAVAAAAAFVRLRRISRRLERLSESYWELRYDHGQLSAKLARLEGPSDAASSSQPAPAATNFVPLSALKK